jgi:cell division protein ZapA
LGAKNRVKLIIADCEISVASEDSEEYIRETGAIVDEYIRNIMKCTPTMSTTLAAMFSALDFCDAASKEKQAADNLRSQITQYSDELTSAKEELEQLRKSEKETRVELTALKAKSGLKALEESRQEQQKTNEK